MEQEYIEYLEKKITEYEKVLDAMRRHADMSDKYVSIIVFKYSDGKDYETIIDWLEAKQ